MITVAHRNGTRTEVSDAKALQLRTDLLVEEHPFSEEDRGSGYAHWISEFWAEGDVSLVKLTGEVLPVL